MPKKPSGFESKLVAGWVDLSRMTAEYAARGEKFRNLRPGGDHGPRRTCITSCASWLATYEEHTRDTLDRK